MMETSERLARPERDSPPEEPAPITAVWLAPKLNERISMASALLVLGPGRPSMIRYALTAIANSPWRVRSILRACADGSRLTPRIENRNFLDARFKKDLGNRRLVWPAF